jgi:hypothetical protein
LSLQGRSRRTIKASPGRVKCDKAMTVNTILH